MQAYPRLGRRCTEPKRRQLQRERLFAIGAERIPQLAGDPGRGVGKRPGVADGGGVTAGAAVSSGGVKTILDEGVHDESVCCWSDGGDW